MMLLAIGLTTIGLTTIGLTTGCARTTQSPAVADNVRKGLKQAGLNDVTVSQDRDKA